MKRDSIKINDSHDSQTLLPFVRHLKDWYRYRGQGNIFQEQTIRLRTIDKRKLEFTIVQLLRRFPVLRSVFNKKEEGLLYRYILDSSTHCYKPEYHSTDNLGGISDEIINSNKYLNLECLPLFKAYVIDAGDIKCLKLCVHHIICNGSSMELLRREFVRLYKNQNRNGNSNKFQDYVNYKHLFIREKFEETISFFLNQFGKSVFYEAKGIKGLIPEKNEINWLNKLSNQEYHVILDTKTAEPLAIDNVVAIKNYDLLLTRLRRTGINILSLMLLPYLLTVRKFFGKDSLIGLLYDDRFNHFSRNGIGEYTGENFIRAAHASEISIRNIRSIQLHVMTLARFLIFNYNLYGLDEKKIYRENCVGFLNFNKTDEAYKKKNEELNVFRKIDFVGLRLEPMVILYSNGYLRINWKFDSTELNKEMLNGLRQSFLQNLNNTLSLLDKDCSIKFLKNH